MPAPWSPMAAPPLPLRNDAEWDTCEHAYPAETCPGYDGPHPALPLVTLPDPEYDLLRFRVEVALRDAVIQPQAVVQVRS